MIQPLRRKAYDAMLARTRKEKLEGRANDERTIASMSAFCRTVLRERPQLAEHFCKAIGTSRVQMITSLDDYWMRRGGEWATLERAAQDEEIERRNP